MQMAAGTIDRVRVVLTPDVSATVERVGREMVRYGLVLVVGWIGAMKFTAYEAMGIQPLVSHSPLLGWMYDFMSVRVFSTMLGFIEIATAALIAVRSAYPRAAAFGSLLAIGIFLTTLSFILSTPGWEPTLGGFPALSTLPGQFLIKDVVLLAASVWSLGDCLQAAGSH
jgi:reactive chlorine resistance protein C